MDQEMTFSLSYEQLTRFAERRIRECNLDSGRDLSLRVSQSRSRADLLA
ncbi:hypothetical protein BANRA_05407 [Escherichia coli]|nr:hypothetical protein BANRA_05407 [Escherichia coli]